MFINNFIYCITDKIYFFFYLKVVDQGLSLSIFPAFMDSDFIFPPIILKYYCFLHAGLVWNRDAVGDMLRFADPEPILKSDIPTDLSILKEVVTLLLMSDRIPKHQIGIYGAILNVFIGEVFFNQLDFSPKPIIDSNPNTPRGLGPNGGQIENLNIDDNKPNSGNLVNTEKHLWALLISPNSVQDSICPSRSDAIYLLRHYRRILNNSKWKATPTVQGGILMAFAFGSKKEEDETPFGIELDTFFSTIQILSVLCKAIILARNSTEKMMKNGDHDQISFGCLMNSLTPGIKSDIANSLLAALEHTSMLSKKRFQVVQLCNSLPPFHQLISANTSCKDQYEKTVIYTKESSDNGTVNIPNDPMPTARSGYLRQIGPVLPALAVMKTISDLLPIPKSLEETLLSIFS